MHVSHGRSGQPSEQRTATFTGTVHLDPVLNAPGVMMREAGRLTLAGRARQIAPGIELTQVGGHTPGQAIVTVATAGGPVVLASDAVHYYEELERDRPFSIVANLADTYAAFDRIRELAQAGALVVAGHDPLVAERFGDPADAPGVIRISRDESRARPA